jgi:hypothetical protein
MGLSESTVPCAASIRVPEAVRGGAADAGIVSDRGGCNLTMEKGQVFDRGVRPAHGRTALFCRERTKETVDEFLRTELNRRQQQRIEAACVDMWEPFRMSIE